MTLESPIAAEMRERIVHLRSMPQTPARGREIAALERALIESSKPTVKTPRSVRAVRRLEREIEEEGEQERPRKKIEHSDGRRKVRISLTPKDETEETGTDKRMRAELKSDILSMIGRSHRGMS